MKYIISVILLIIVFGFSACKEDGNGEVEETATLNLELSHTVGGEALVFNTQVYSNALGEKYNIQDFKYYLSNIKLRNASDGTFFLEPESYHLVQAEEGNNFVIVIENIPLGKYSQLEFAIGVDNATNTSTDRLGALDPSNEMAWDWNTGYKFLLLEGKYGTAEDQLNEGLVYHIGGDANYRILKFDLKTNGDELELKANQEHSIALDADVAAIFAAPNPVSFAEHPVVMHDPFSQKVADNYAANMFSLSTLK